MNEAIGFPIVGTPAPLLDPSLYLSEGMGEGFRGILSSQLMAMLGQPSAQETNKASLLEALSQALTQQTEHEEAPPDGSLSVEMQMAQWMNLLNTVQTKVFEPVPSDPLSVGPVAETPVDPLQQWIKIEHPQWADDHPLKTVFLPVSKDVPQEGCCSLEKVPVDTQRKWAEALKRVPQDEKSQLSQMLDQVAKSGQKVAAQAAAASSPLIVPNPLDTGSPAVSIRSLGLNGNDNGADASIQETREASALLAKGDAKRPALMGETRSDSPSDFSGSLFEDKQVFESRREGGKRAEMFSVLLNYAPTTTTTATLDAGRADPTPTLSGSAPLEVVQQVSRHMEAMALNRHSEMTLSLEPKQLGKVEVSIQIDSDKQVAVQMNVDRADVRDVINKNAHELKESLAHHGLKIDQFDVRVVTETQSRDFSDSTAYSFGSQSQAFDQQQQASHFERRLSSSSVHSEPIEELSAVSSFDRSRLVDLVA